MIKNIIFDWAGVINDSTFIVYKAAMIEFKKFGVKEISFEEFRKEWEQPHMLFYNKYLPELTPEEENRIYESAYKKVVSENPPRPYSGIKDTLEKFKRAGIKMIIISADLKETLFQEVKSFDLKSLFQEINSDVYDKFKVIKEIIKRNNFNPKETIFIGDTTHEINAGKSAGALTAAVTWGFQNEDKLKSAEPDFIIHNLEELEEIIL